MNADVLSVALAFSPTVEVPVGRLALDGNAVIFEYHGGFAASGLSLNPAFGLIGPGLLRARDPQSFRGLHGVFADSLPDAWGQLLMERRLRRTGIAIAALTVLDRLAWVGRRGRGALVYEPASDNAEEDSDVDLDQLMRDVHEVLEGDEATVLREMERLGGSSGGARPKVHVALDDSGHARSDDNELPPGYSSWIVKFRASVDRFADIGPLEAAYAQTARRAGITMPRTRLISSPSGPGYFATERFDRGPGGQRFHMLSIGGMLDADWSVPSIDYENLMEAVRRATRDEQAVTEIFRRMVFNVLAVNRDDHAKQHALLLGSDGAWHLSPAYDLTLAAGPGNEHYLAINGRGRDITQRDILAVAERQSIAARRAHSIIDEVATSVAALPSIANDFGVTRTTLDEIKRATEEQLSLVNSLWSAGPPIGGPGLKGEPDRSSSPKNVDEEIGGKGFHW
ncbi:MAG TPA: type II toxin-antitoxin system HipA family toxin [Candidatus Baltobacteraceae bacterium]|jgi:serine/threonine-protein kinase HipA|nr:type II toxin-antitoxin system HipA family toxin [Candidatus Baltobacteraceae bacterium]